MQLENILSANGPVLVTFGAEWCAPCQWLEPILERLRNDLAGRIRIHKIDIDKEPELSRQWHIRSVPTLILFRDAQPVWRYQGFDTAEKMKQVILEHLQETK